MKGARIACAIALVACGEGEPAPIAGDGPVDALADASMPIDAPACDRAFFDAAPGHRGCSDGEIVPCDGLIPPACSISGCCPVVYELDRDRNRCCGVYVTINPYLAPCCTSPDLLLNPEACQRCEWPEGPW